mmetsp:Transcript_38799/g.99590  ORF Transcript_38799/g.99590 Transcript_38799/m.99590 type:complete len:374 (-) Transcript_38799:1013-2134(-)|eukprot:CAMPEP_0113874216 /NCGR_PEP_ID=MMETSP0780_2-20120614/4207_1 /TAXON_ID=652834 /ORGANISM="Palpitomonas bilix" /LENGTH=373 /DNA_ID=CAMNT_0000859957 /DNA_START=69 /DNA_END=1190 /DNA_ORIENTATION=+ /assembly_acc=CAM_ASM_000599
MSAEEQSKAVGAEVEEARNETEVAAESSAAAVEATEQSSAAVESGAASGEQHMDASHTGEGEGDLKPEELRTLYVYGLPSNVCEREMFNFFRFFDGFEDATVRLNRSTAAFILFATHEQAKVALEKVSGIIFDRDIGAPMRVEFARSNTKPRDPSKRPRGDRRAMDALPATIDKRPRRDDFKDVGSLMRDVLLSGMAGADRQPAARAFAEAAMTAAARYDPYARAQQVNNPPAPCSTLFVANIPIGTRKEELYEIFSRLSGFKNMSFREGKPVSFVDFDDVSMSTQAMNTLQGFRMHPEDPAGLRVEFAKSKMSSRTVREENPAAQIVQQQQQQQYAQYAQAYAQQQAQAQVQHVGQAQNPAAAAYSGYYTGY